MSVSRAIAFSLIASVATITGTTAFAQDATISMEVTSAGFIIGASGGNGVLSFKGKNYPISVKGLQAGFTLGISKADMKGNVYNLKNLSDIEGTYSGGGAGAAIIGGESAVSLENSKGVKLELSGKQKGLEASISGGGVKIALEGS